MKRKNKDNPLSIVSTLFIIPFALVLNTFSAAINSSNFSLLASPASIYFFASSFASFSRLSAFLFNFFTALCMISLILFSQQRYTV